MKTIRLWVVEGHTGEYSDHQQWTVAACISEDAGKKLEAACVEWVTMLGMFRGGRRTGATLESEIRYQVTEAIRNGLLPDAPDQQLRCDYTGVDYVCVPLDLRLHDDQEFEDFADALVAYRAKP